MRFSFLEVLFVRFDSHGENAALELFLLCCSLGKVVVMLLDKLVNRRRVIPNICQCTHILPPLIHGADEDDDKRNMPMIGRVHVL